MRKMPACFRRGASSVIRVQRRKDCVMKRKLNVLFRVTAVLLCAILMISVLASCDLSAGSQSSDKERADAIKKMENLLENAAHQYPHVYGDFYCDVYDTHIVILKYKGLGGVVTIPAELDGLPVYVVEAEAFKDTGVTKVIVEEGVYAIKESCFSECVSLTSVQLPKSLFELGRSAFSGCVSLKSLEFPSSLALVPESVCYGCSSLETAKVLAQNNKCEIGARAFIGCTSLRNVYISGSVTTIKNDAFTYVPETVIIHAPAGSEAARFSADNFFNFVVTTDEELMSSASASETEKPAESDTATETQDPESSDSTSLEDTAENKSSVLALVIVIVILLGLAGVVVGYLIMQKKRKGY